MFRRWMHDAVAAGLHEPNAMVLSTVSAEGAPASRIVLLKGIDERGFVFFTNYESRKADDLDARPRCALLFPWHPLAAAGPGRGHGHPAQRAENDAYFGTRPRGSQLGAWASPQSEVVTDRWSSRRATPRPRSASARGDVPLPDHWGGYCVVPEPVEFWQGRLGRMHDRLRYRRTPSGWAVERLAP